MTRRIIFTREKDSVWHCCYFIQGTRIVSHKINEGKRNITWKWMKDWVEKGILPEMASSLDLDAGRLFEINN